MALRSILLHFVNSRTGAARTDYALRLAQKHDAHLTAFHCVPPLNLPPHVEGMIPATVRQIQLESAVKAAAAAKSAFEAAAKRAGLSARVEWRHGEGDLVQRLALDARYADLVVVGQGNPDAEEVEEPVDLPGELALAAGRPVLAVPYAGTFPTLGERVLVAWNASRESARAVADAMPILGKAGSVTVLAVNPQIGPGVGAAGHGEQPGADIALHLARHGVRAEATRASSDEIDPGDVILSRASDLSVDMIVMGAYGRSRLREMVLGGVTQLILRHMTVPVLMSH